MEKLCSMKQLKCLLIDRINGINVNGYQRYHEILAKEMPQLTRPENAYFYIGGIDDSGRKQVDFLPPNLGSQDLESESESE